jgi:hypothetical protein
MSVARCMGPVPSHAGRRSVQLPLKATTLWNFCFRLWGNQPDLPSNTKYNWTAFTAGKAPTCAYLSIGDARVTSHRHSPLTVKNLSQRTWLPGTMLFQHSNTG